MKKILKTGLKTLIPGLNGFFTNGTFYFGISLKLTSSCNLRCKYCSAVSEKKEANIDDIIEFLINMRKKGLFYVILSGGECFFYSHINRLMEFLLCNDFYVVINTNGTLLHNPGYRELIVKADEIVVSVDGDRKTNDSGRGKGSLEKILNTLRFLKKKRKKVTLSTVVWKENCKIGTLEFFKKIREKYRVNLDFEKLSPELIPESQKNRVIPDNLSLKRFSEDLSFYRRKYNWNEISDISIKNLVNSRPILCRSSNFVLYMDCDGNLYPCVDTLGKKDFLIGNIRNFRGKDKQQFYCSRGCFCNSLLNLNNILSGNIDIRYLVRWLS